MNELISSRPRLTLLGSCRHRYRQEIVPHEAVSGALSNRLVEDGVLPGLDATIEEYGKLSEQARSEGELATAAAARSSPKR